MAQIPKGRLVEGPDDKPIWEDCAIYVSITQVDQQKHSFNIWNFNMFSKRNINNQKRGFSIRHVQIRTQNFWVP